MNLSLKQEGRRYGTPDLLIVMSQSLWWLPLLEVKFVMATSLGSKEFMMATTLRSEGGQSDIEHITYKVLHGLKILNTSGMKWAP